MATDDEIPDRLSADNTYFKSLLDMIPPRYYFDEETKQQFRKETEQDTETEETSTSKKRKKSKKSKADPIHLKTVTQLHAEMDEGEKVCFTKTKKQRKENKHEKKEKEFREEKMKVEEFKDHQFRSSFEDLEDLQAKLHRKIDELKHKRGHSSTDDFRERKRLKRRESKLKLKMKRRKEKQNTTKETKAAQTRLVNGGGGSLPAKSPAKPVYNKEGKMVFSKFDFTDHGVKEKAPSGVLTGKDYKRLLGKLEKSNKKLNEVREKDKEAAKTLEEKAAWKKMIGKAEGFKVKDNPEMLKKALKQKEHKHDMKKKKWGDRMRSVNDKLQEKQDKRTKNIDKRKQGRIDKKMKRAKKKGRIIPGF